MSQIKQMDNKIKGICDIYAERSNQLFCPNFGELLYKLSEWFLFDLLIFEVTCPFKLLLFNSKN